MAYKFQRGAAVASGSFTAEEGLVATTGGLTVSAGNSSLQTLTASALSVDSVLLDANILSGLVQLTSSNSSLGVAVGTSFSGSGAFQAGTTLTVGGLSTLNGGVTTTTATATSIQALNYKANDGTAAITIADTTGQVTISTNLVANGNTTLGNATTDIIDVIGRFSSSLVPSLNTSFDLGLPTTNLWRNVRSQNLSCSTDLFAGNAATIGNGLTVTAGTTNVGTLVAAGTTVTTITGSGLAQFQSLTVNGGTATFATVDINGGAIDGTNIGASTPGTGQFSTLSASSTLIAGGLATFNNGLTVSSGDSSVQKLTVNGDLIVLGDTFSASVGTLLIEDAAIVIGDGQTVFASDYGLLFGSGSGQWASLLTAQANIDGVAGNENVLSSSLAIKAPAFAGTVYGTIATTVTSVANGATFANGVNYFADLTSDATGTLPAAPSAGDTVQIKCKNLTNAAVRVNAAGTQKIDAEDFIVLESPYAAVTLVYVASNDWRVF